MGKELEFKLQVSDPQTLLQILNDPEILSRVEGEWREIPMKTTYFDNSLGQFSKYSWTFRHRMEGDASVVCLKTPHPDKHVRNEWETEGEMGDQAVAALIEQGAPLELLAFYGDGNLTPRCGAEFVRRCVMLRFADGSRAELAGDVGLLRGRTQEEALCELELELYEGEATQTIALVQDLCQRYGLQEQPKSKYARAKALQ